MYKFRFFNRDIGSMHEGTSLCSNFLPHN